MRKSKMDVQRRAEMMTVRIRLYDGEGRPVGEMEFPAPSVEVWLKGQGDPRSEELAAIRDLVDPDHETEPYTWDVWAKPREVGEDLSMGSDDGLLSIE